MSSTLLWRGKAWLVTLRSAPGTHRWSPRQAWHGPKSTQYENDQLSSIYVCALCGLADNMEVRIPCLRATWNQRYMGKRAYVPKGCYRH